jgi:hypothetical protein
LFSRYFDRRACVFILTSSFTEETIMTSRKHLYLLSFLFLSFAVASPAQSPDSQSPPQDQTQSPSSGGSHGSGRGGQRDGNRTIGKITSLSGKSLQVARPDGSTVTVNLTDKTEYRKDRQPVQLSEFKVGDFVMVRGDENSDHSITAQSLSGRSANGPGGPGGGSGGGMALGEMGKDFVAGVVKSIDAPKLTILRVDNVTQTLELNEETSLRRGRESITMADIQAGDHVVARGGLQQNVFVPKSVILLSSEQWERMQQFAQAGAGSSGHAKAPVANSPQQ